MSTETFTQYCDHGTPRRETCAHCVAEQEERPSIGPGWGAWMERQNAAKRARIEHGPLTGGAKQALDCFETGLDNLEIFEERRNELVLWFRRTLGTRAMRLLSCASGVSEDDMRASIEEDLGKLAAGEDITKQKEGEWMLMPLYHPPNDSETE